MRIERLSLKGLMRFTEPVTLDLRDLPAGLIALTGENGAGKTTLLEAPIAALYRGFASRDGQLTEYATGRDSYIEIDVALDGRGTYRARLNLDGPKKASDAVLEQIQPNGGRVVLNDGKVSTYSAVVADTFPSKDVLLASAFASQNKTGSFISLDKRERKELFMRLLAIERYQTMSETARQAASAVEQARIRLGGMRETLVQDTSDAVLDALDRLANDLQAQGGTAESDRRELAAQIETLESRLAVLADAVAAHAAATQRVQTLQQQLATRRAERDGLAQERDTARRQRGDEQARLQAAHDAQLAETDKLLTNNRRLLDNAETVHAAVTAIEAAQTQLATLRPRERQVQTDVEALDTAHQALQRQVTALQVRQEDLRRAEHDWALLENVPCAGAGTYATCRFLTNAQQAGATIPSLRADVGQLDAVTAQITANRQQHDTTRRVLASVREDIGRHEQALAIHQPFAALKDKVLQAEARIEELTRKRTEQIETAAQLAREAADRYEARLGDLGDREARALAAAGDLHDDLTTAEQDLAAATDGNARALTVQSDLRALRARWDVTTATVARVEAAHADLQRRWDDLTAKRGRLATLDATDRTLGDELLDWQFLAKAFGRDGLPVLEIDAAGPTISAYTNELLTVCFGARFSVELITQRVKADGKGFVDDFSVRVFDNQAGGDPRDIADLSGGEQVIVAEALMNAISIYVNTTAPIPVRTCWRDETTGALDPENAQRYLAMLRKVQELGGFHHVFFISHNQAVADQADAQIQVRNGGAVVAYPPFSEAA